MTEYFFCFFRFVSSYFTQFRTCRFVMSAQGFWHLSLFLERRHRSISGKRTLMMLSNHRTRKTKTFFFLLFFKVYIVRYKTYFLYRTRKRKSKRKNNEQPNRCSFFNDKSCFVLHELNYIGQVLRRAQDYKLQQDQ